MLNSFRIWSLSSILMLAAVQAVHAQSFSFGAKVGAPLTGAYNTVFVPDGGASSSDRRFIIGPTAELRLPFHVGFEVDALWRRSSFSSISGNPSFNLSSSVNDWQFPFLLKYEMGPFLIHPFLDAGVTFRHVSTTSSSVPSPNNPNGAGITLGGGLALKVLLIRLSPEIRYTHWNSQPFANGKYSPVASTSNQVDVLMGITF